MTARAFGTGRNVRPPQTGNGRRPAVVALAMLPAMAVVFVALEFLGSALGHALGLEEQQLLTEAGGRGVAAAVLVIALSAIVPAIGMLLALRARRLGEGRLAAVALVVWSLIGIGFVVIPTLGLVFS